MAKSCRCVNCIVPPHLLRNLAKSRDDAVREAALRTLLSTERLRGERTVRTMLGTGTARSPSQGRRTIFTCDGGTRLLDAKMVRTEQGPMSADTSVNQAFDGIGTTRDFYKSIFGRNSIDGAGMRLDGYVHRGKEYNNAFWDGQEMVFGDGDGVLFTDFTASLDVIAHELTHGVTERTAGLEYHKQSGALNESISDVFGSLVKQWSKKQSAEEADWLVGAEVFTPRVKGDALRSLKAPGTAYNDPEAGKDPQPDHMTGYVDSSDDEDGDFGGVHINSGIPNKAFYLTAKAIGGHAWESPGLIWYEALKASTPTTDFQEFADTTAAKAGQLFGDASTQKKAVSDAWAQVGLIITAPGAGRSILAKLGNGKEADGESLGALLQEIAALSEQVRNLAQHVDELKEGLPSVTAPSARMSQRGGARRGDQSNSN